MDGIKLLVKKEKELETLIQTIKISLYDIEMEFGIEKCDMLIMKNRKRQMIEGIQPTNQERIRTLREN